MKSLVAALRSLPYAKMGATDINEWIEIVAKCQYLPENELKVTKVILLIEAHPFRVVSLRTLLRNYVTTCVICC